MKYLFLATEDNPMQLMHLLLNATKFSTEGHEVVTVLECSSPKLLIGLEDGSIKLPIFFDALEAGLIDHACKACSAKVSASEAAEKLGVELRGELKGHSDLYKFVKLGFSIISF
ncbi:hypothetical protein EU537_01055 [Candidatus Thorarchaeota archaeon]|nr:MAG: hypothetical protein EU537_01055 [Candidatus Thorarchaeota archaeon]